MSKRLRVGVGTAAIAAMVLAAVMCWAQSSGSLWQEADERVTEMMSTPWKSDVVVLVTVKDEAGNPLKVLAEVGAFYAIGSQGGHHSELIEFDGAKRLEFKGVSTVDVSLFPANLEDTHEASEREWNFNNLDPDEFEFGADGRTIIVRYDAVLRSFPREERPELVRVSLYIDRDRGGGTDNVLLYEPMPNKPDFRMRSIPLITGDRCTTPTLLSAYVSAPEQLSPKIIGRANFYPNGKHVVLRVCSPLEEDGLQYSGVFLKKSQFGNTTPEAPSEGYVKQLLLPYEWFEEEKRGVVFVRLGGLYGKVVLHSEQMSIRDYDAIDPVARPSMNATLLYNPTGSRNLRTTHPQ